VFEPKFTKPDSTLVEGDHRYELVFGGRTFVLYQHSYLGYGLMRARKHVHQFVDFMDSIRTKGNAAGESVKDRIIGNPCLAKGTRRVVQIDRDRQDGGLRNVTMDGEDVGSFEGCKRVIELVMAKDAYVTSISFFLSSFD
jgi:guanosine-diphosphatase